MADRAAVHPGKDPEARRSGLRSPPDIKARLVERALAEGFAALGICAPDAAPQTAEGLAGFLAAGHHGQMDWLAQRTEWRGSAAALWPEARSVIMLAEPYTPETDPRAVLAHPDRAAISVYAQGRDYHDLVKKRLKRPRPMAGRNDGGGDQGLRRQPPRLMEKPLAAAAGLGWQGKHTNLLSRDLGNWFFLGAIFTTLDLPKDAAAAGHCGTCTACLDICPTRAFPAPHRLDARRCISYLTIEHKGPVDEALRPALGNRIYGCDDCLAVCPWNKFAVAASESGYLSRTGRTAPSPNLRGSTTRPSVRDFPAARSSASAAPGFCATCFMQSENAADPSLAHAARPHLRDPDAAVADAARWALARLGVRA